MPEKERSSGVQELIDRLREKGIEEGREQAEQLVADAQRRATEILDKARQQAAQILQHARDESNRVRAAGNDALRLAGRDTLLALKEEISDQFARQVHQLASHCLRDEQFMQRLILEIAGRAVPKDSNQPVELLLPEDVLPPQEAGDQMKEAKEGTLNHFVLSLSGEMMREGVALGVAADDRPGVTVRRVDEDIEISFNDQAIAEFLLRHLLPRFQALMEGIV